MAARLAAMKPVGWLPDPTEESLHAALASAAPELAGLPLRLNRRLPSSNQLWWSASAVVDESFVVKFAWSEVRAMRLWREGVILERLSRIAPALPVPEVVALSRQPALVVTRLVPGGPLGGEWAWRLAGDDAEQVAGEIAAFLGGLHEVDPTALQGDLAEVVPTPQADTELLRRRFPGLVDHPRAAAVLSWCDWVDGVLNAAPAPSAEVFVHGDLHGYNQVWEQERRHLVAVVDFEESGLADPNFDFRYLPGNARSLDLLLAAMGAYQDLCGRPLALDRVMAWNVLTVLGDALWRTEANVALPGGGTAASWVDDLGSRLSALGLA